MGLLLSMDARQAFVQMLRIALEVGWDEQKIGRELGVGPPDLKNMLSGFLVPSQKHVFRLTELVKSDPPKRILPPAPSRPIVKPPPFHPMKTNGHTESLEIPMNSEPETMLTNGAATSAEDANPRYKLITKKKAKLLRRAMQETLEAKYAGSVSAMAKALSIGSSGLTKIFRNKRGSIAESTLKSYSALTGWSSSDPDEAHTNGAKKPLRGHLLPEDELAAFRDELRPLVEEHGASKVAREMKCNGGALRLILNGKGSTYKMLARFRSYKEGKKTGNKPSQRNGKVTPTHTPERRPSAIQLGPGVDLYKLAGLLLNQEHDSEAHVVSLIAQVSESVPLSRITETLKQLLAE